MALVPHTVTALAESNEDGTDGKNIVAGAVCTMADLYSGSYVTLYDNDEYSNGSTAKTTNPKGYVTFYLPAGDYIQSVNGEETKITVSEVYKFADTRTPQGSMLSSVKLTKNDKWSGKSISILGDSISWGSNCPDVYQDSYAAILRRMLLADKGSESIGFISARGQATNSMGTYQDFHSISTSGAWDFNNLSEATTVINGFSRFSSEVGAYLDIVAPLATTMFRVFYRQKTGGGTFTISNDGGATIIKTVDTSGAEDGSSISQLVGMKDNGSGDCSIRIEIVSGSVEILGVQYLNAFDDYLVNNFSDPGRKILHTETNVFDDACTASALVFALGYNDRGSSETEKIQVEAKIDYLISKVVETKTKLYVVDTNWGYESSNWIREQLKRLAGSVIGGVYIPLPDLLSNDGEILSITELRDEFGFLSDGAHPTPDGHRVVAETIAKNIGLSVTSKSVVDKVESSSFLPEEGTLTPTVDFVTTGDFIPAYTIQEGFYRKVGDMVYFGLTVRFDSNAYTTAAGNFAVRGLPFVSSSDNTSFYEYALNIGVMQKVDYLDNANISAFVVRGGSEIQFRQNLPALDGGGIGVDNIPASTANIRLAISGWYIAE